MRSLTQSQLSLAIALRRSNQIEMALNTLNSLYAQPALHPVDAQQKICEHIKCLLRLADTPSTAPASSGAYATLRQNAQEALYDALDVIENTELQFLKQDQISKLMVMKGVILSKLDK